MMNPQLQTILREVRETFERIYGSRLSNIVLFGPQARGTAVEGSDIDILIVLKGSVSPGGEIHRAAESTAEISLRHNVVKAILLVRASRSPNPSPPLVNTSCCSSPIQRQWLRT